MDEEDFRFKKRPGPKKRPQERPNWEVKLFAYILEYVLREPEDFFFKKEVASSLHASEVDVGHCLASLCKEGILIHKAVDPSEYDEVYVGKGSFPSTITWFEGRWVWGKPPVFRHKGFGNYRNHCISRDRRVHRSKRDVAKALKKNPVVPVSSEQWDGKAYFIIRGQQFAKACKTAGFPSDPKTSWTCPKCGKKSFYDAIRCENYKVSPPCDYQRPHQNFWPPLVQLVTCEKCGQKLEPGQKSHPKIICNLNIVRFVMDQ